MIVEYHRPQTIQEALLLLSRKDPLTIPLGGGTHLSGFIKEPVAVVDLQRLGLDIVKRKGNFTEIGSTVNLQDLVRNEHICSGLKSAARYEAPYNLRHMATVAGTLLTADGRSPFATAMLAVDAQFTFQPGENLEAIGNHLPLQYDRSDHRLIVNLVIPNEVDLVYLYVARTPADFPIISTAVARWTSGRTRVVVGGFGKFPKLAMDGPDSYGAEIAVQNVCYEAEDEWASATYRRDVAKILTRRCLNLIDTRNFDI